jgi:hypothetical protein
MQNTDEGTYQEGGQPQQEKKAISSMRWVLYIIVAIAAVLVIFLFFTSSSPYLTITQTMSTNSTPKYMSISHAELLLGAPTAGYNTSDMFSQKAPINMSQFVMLVPQLYGNVSSGWVTVAFGSSIMLNSTFDFFVVTTRNPQAMAGLIGSAVTSSLRLTPDDFSPGTQNGLSYTYSTYSNSTFSLQVLYGWKGDNAVLLLMHGNSAFSPNKEDVVDVVSSDTPLH